MSRELDSEKLIPYLKERGLRITPQRMLILKTIASMKGHPTVEDIHLQLPSISMATIYNNVKMLVKLNILNELPYGQGLSKYEFKIDEHYHVICHICGTIEDFKYPLLKEVEHVAKQLTKFHVHSHQLEFYGICTPCSKQKLTN
jgi:Fur family transcriptional regulator, peroxide stress response regulator